MEGFLCFFFLSSFCSFFLSFFFHLTFLRIWTSRWRTAHRVEDCKECLHQFQVVTFSICFLICRATSGEQRSHASAISDPEEAGGGRWVDDTRNIRPRQLLDQGVVHVVLLFFMLLSEATSIENLSRLFEVFRRFMMTVLMVTGLAAVGVAQCMNTTTTA